MLATNGINFHQSTHSIYSLLFEQLLGNYITKLGNTVITSCVLCDAVMETEGERENRPLDDKGIIVMGRWHY